MNKVKSRNRWKADRKRRRSTPGTNALHTSEDEANDCGVYEVGE